MPHLILGEGGGGACETKCVVSLCVHFFLGLQICLFLFSQIKAFNLSLETGTKSIQNSEQLSSRPGKCCKLKYEKPKWTYSNPKKDIRTNYFVEVIQLK